MTPDDEQGREPKGGEPPPSALQEKTFHLVFYTEGEELANRLTHGLGALLSLIGMIFLLAQTAAYGEIWRIVSCAIYGSTLVIFYCLSTLYHTIRTPRIRYLFRILDHAAIFVLIAGTYTPFSLVSLRGPWGWSIFGVIWGLALAGVVFKIFMVGKLPIVAPILYIGMGWIIVVALKPLMNSVPAAGIWWLFAGGIIYTLGIIFYAWDRFPFNHAIWHLFVLGGSACHFLAVLFYVVPVN